jgi:hypothetical protein
MKKLNGTYLIILLGFLGVGCTNLNGQNPGVQLKGSVNLSELNNLSSQASEGILSALTKASESKNFVSQVNDISYAAVIRCDDDSIYLLMQEQGSDIAQVAYSGAKAQDGCLASLEEEQEAQSPGDPSNFKNANVVKLPSRIYPQLTSGVHGVTGNTYEKVAFSVKIKNENISLEEHFSVFEASVKGGPGYDKQKEKDQRKVIHSAMQCVDLINLGVRKSMIFLKTPADNSYYVVCSS